MHTRQEGVGRLGVGEGWGEARGEEGKEGELVNRPIYIYSRRVELAPDLTIILTFSSYSHHVHIAEHPFQICTPAGSFFFSLVG